jgi:hypothetical protein
MKSSRLVFAFVLAAAGLLSGCASSQLVRVQPWERAALADFTMRPDRDPLHTALAEHIYFSRESATASGHPDMDFGCNS